MYVGRFIISFSIIANLNSNFDFLLRTAFLLQESMKRERNDLSSLANPFSPAELEKWFALKLLEVVRLLGVGSSPRAS